MKAYSQDLRDRVIETYKNGEKNKTKLAKIFHVTRETVRECINRYERNGDYSSKQGENCGPPFKFTNKEAILTFMENNPDTNAVEIRDALFPECPMSTWYDTMSRFEITYKKRALL